MDQLNEEQLILVDAGDREIGTAGKLEAHEKGLLHRAFSVFVFNNDGDILLQRRALDKYHSAGLWTNTCCSHPRPGEETAHAATRRLNEEMGIRADVHHQFSFTYRFEFENGLIENEYDHVFLAFTNDIPAVNPAEVMDWKYIGLEDLQRDLALNPDNYTVWLRLCFPEIVKLFKARKRN